MKINLGEITYGKALSITAVIWLVLGFTLMGIEFEAFGRQIFIFIIVYFSGISLAIISAYGYASNQLGKKIRERLT